MPVMTVLINITFLRSLPRYSDKVYGLGTQRMSLRVGHPQTMKKRQDINKAEHRM